MKLKTQISPQRHRDTEKGKTKKSNRNNFQAAGLGAGSPLCLRVSVVNGFEVEVLS